MTLRPVKRALLSVSDKSGLLDLARGLIALGVELISTGGTRKTLLDAGLAVLEVAEVTGFPEMLDGRVKTLHPFVHGGILAVRDNPEHEKALTAHGIQHIDLVVCNLYPFVQTVTRGANHEDVVENIDIGGPTLVRAAAKNYQDVAIVTNPGQYAEILAELTGRKGALSLETRERLAAAAFARIEAYDRAIADYFAARVTGAASFPTTLTRTWERKQELRYGENPHQKAAFYVDPAAEHPCVATAKVLHGKELSYNNILDLDSAFGLVREFAEPAAVVIKHNNPCGTAIGTTLEEAFKKAHEGDPLSAYGGVLAFNREVDEATATQVTEPNRFIECVIAPGYSEAALALFTTRPTWKKSVRLLATGPLKDVQATTVLRDVDGGLLVQERDRNNAVTDFREVKVVTKRQPTAEEMADLRFAWVVCKHVKSNAIVLTKGGMIVGVGAGQMSRIDSVFMAVRKANGRERGAVLGSDAFFPFRDNVDEAAKAGVTAVVQPGGSMRDADSIAACDEHGLAMVFTGVRHFRH